MMLRNGLIAAATAACAFALAGAASAAPLSAAASPSANAGANVDSSVTDVGWKQRRQCRRGHCRWTRVWVPGVSIVIGNGHRNRHHNRRHRH